MKSRKNNNRENIGENLCEQNVVAREISLKLLSWAAFIEKQSEYEGYPELEGLGMSLREYSEALDRSARILDEMEVELTALMQSEPKIKQKRALKPGR